MHLCLFEDDQVGHLQPLTLTRGAYDLRLGMRTLLETIRDAFDNPPTILHARPLVAEVVAQENGLPVNTLPTDHQGILFVNGRWAPEPGPLLERLQRAAQSQEPACIFVQGNILVAAWVPEPDSELLQHAALHRDHFGKTRTETVEYAPMVGRLWHFLDALRPALVADWEYYTQTRTLGISPEASVHPSALLVNPDQIHIAEQATVRPGAILNADAGPIYIGSHATVMEGAVLRGPLYIGAHAQVKIMGNIEGCAIGPWCKVGGEVHSSIMHSFSNKGHAGFLGHAYIGRWCNLGADTNNSNLKNDYGLVSLYNEVVDSYEKSNRQFLGLIMADHAKCGINSMFNTGTVIGVNCNLYGAGLHDRYVPSFSWGSAEARYQPYRIDKALQVAEAVMARRNMPLTDADRRMLTAIAAKRWTSAAGGAL